MEKRPHALLLTFPGTNCEHETARALKEAGFSTAIVTLTELDDATLNAAQLVVFSGGFSYGDYIMSGRLATLELTAKIGDKMKTFRDNGGYLLGICNGFQILTKLGLMPEGSLIHNTSGKFICKWVTLENKQPDNAFLHGLPDEFEFPVAHAEGRFVIDPEQAKKYLDDGLVTLTYKEPVNGSIERIAGLRDETGRVFGLMPHPERFIYAEQHYDADWDGDAAYGWGHFFFESIFKEINEKATVAG